jgi:ATP-binding cassette, subfamily B, bacterial MsbA
VTLNEFYHDIGVFRRLFAISNLKAWFVPAMVLLGLVAAFLEAISLALVIPLLQVINDSTGAKAPSALVRQLNEMVDLVPIDSRILAIVAAIVAAVIFKGVVGYTNMVLLGLMYGRTSHAIRTRLFAHILAMPLAQLERDRIGRFVDTINTQSWRASDATQVLFTVIISLTAVVVLVALLAIVSWPLTLIAAILVTTVPPLTRAISRRLKRLDSTGAETNKQLTQGTSSTLKGMRVVHAFAQEATEIERFRSASDRVRQTYFRTNLASMTKAPVTDLLIALVLVLSALLVEASQVALPILAGFFAILYRLRPRAISVAQSHARLLELEESIFEVRSLLAASTDAPAEKGPKKPFTKLREGIRFENVSFSYPNSNRFALRNVSFHIRRGSMVAIVGASGAGKSTLLDLVLRFHKPQQGLIRVDGMPLSDIDPAAWRAAIGVVGQDPYIFEDTISANIRYGRPDATPQEVEAVAHFAHADDFIQTLPHGYDTVVGNGETPLTGGQRQRLALARALLRNPNILLLDETANVLDGNSERAFQDALIRFARDRTVIVVAHRLSMIERADFAIVLEEGAAVQEGPPHTLLGLEGAYAKMFRSAPPRLESIRTLESQ